MKALGLASLALAAYGAAAALESPLDGQAVTLVTRPSDRRVDVLVGGQPVHLIHLSRVTREAGALSDSHCARHAGDTRVPARTQARRARRPSASCRALVQLRRRQRLRFLGSLIRNTNRAEGEGGHDRSQRDRAGGKWAARGELAVKADWVVPDGSVLIHEQTRFVFAGGTGRRAVDRVTTWTARKSAWCSATRKKARSAFVSRVRSSIRRKRPKSSSAPAARKETVPRLDNTGVTGRYLGSDGTTGEAVWGHADRGWH